MRPVIAVAPCSRLGDYLASIRNAGAEARVLDWDADDAAQVVRDADGVLLTGGADIDPGRYGQSEHPSYEPAEAGRDAFEIDLVRAAVEADAPVLAICRGMQALNVALGGALIQDVPTQVPGSIEHALLQPRNAIAHGVAIDEGTLLARLLPSYGPDRGVLPVNSRHHQAVDQPAEGLRVSARAPDGVIEAIERPASTFCLGVQWHPENFHESGEFAALFEAFVDACRERQARRSASQA
jgi:putative glutamine amidotransferase